MSNPIDEFLEMDKHAFFGDLVRGAASEFAPQAAKSLGGKLVGGALLAAGTIGLTKGVGAAATMIYDAVDKRRGFKQMMSLDPSLKGVRKENPDLFNAAYSSLRNVNPTFGKDPLIAGSHMHRFMSVGPEMVGLTIAGTVQAPKAPGQQPDRSMYRPESLYQEPDPQADEMGRLNLSRARRGERDALRDDRESARQMGMFRRK